MYLHFRREIDITQNSITACAMSHLIEAISRGEKWAIMLWMRRYAGFILKKRRPSVFGNVSVDQRSAKRGGDDRPFTCADFDALAAEIEKDEREGITHVPVDRRSVKRDGEDRPLTLADWDRLVGEADAADEREGITPA